MKQPYIHLCFLWVCAPFNNIWRSWTMFMKLRIGTNIMHKTPFCNSSNRWFENGRERSAFILDIRAYQPTALKHNYLQERPWYSSLLEIESNQSHNAAGRISFNCKILLPHRESSLRPYRLQHSTSSNFLQPAPLQNIVRSYPLLIFVGSVSVSQNRVKPLPSFHCKSWYNSPAHTSCVETAFTDLNYILDSYLKEIRTSNCPLHRGHTVA
jgi:hypothetical protein